MKIVIIGNSGSGKTWLDLDWPTCRARLERRETNMEVAQSRAGLAKLLDWPSAYYSRSDKRSHEGHREIFERFTGIHIRLRNEEASNAFINDAQWGAPTNAIKRAAQS